MHVSKRFVAWLHIVLTYALWSSLATAKLYASMGFQAMQFDAKLRTVRWSGMLVRRSYKMTARSVAQEAKIEVSTWLKETWLMVSMAEGQTMLCTGAPDVRVVSYIETVLDAAANEGSVRWCETDVKAALPCHVAFGAVFEACEYGSNMFT
jgi:hypothetical protein